MRIVQIFFITLLLIISGVLVNTAWSQDQLFIRGDVDADGDVDQADADMLSNHVFMMQPLTCHNAGDVNDDGTINMFDVTALGSFVGTQSPVPPPPYPNCGTDPTNPQPGADCCVEEATGACCMPDGSCVDAVTSADCLSAGGTYQGDDTDCASVTCPLPTGACCFGDGSCVDAMTVSDCELQGGTYQGDGTSCASVTCTPSEPTTSAPTPTVHPDYVFSVFSDVYSNTEFDTWSFPWDYGDVTPFTIGADNIKKFVFWEQRWNVSEYSPTQDINTMTHVHFDVWTPDVTDESTIFRIKLVDFGTDGVWNDPNGPGPWDDVEHELIYDQSTMSTGVWISFDLALADFTGMTTREHFAQFILSGTYDIVFVDNIYFYDATPATTGACCFGDGSCADAMTLGDCESQGGTYQGDDTDCASITCTVPTGACCFGDGSCADDMTLSDCESQGGTYYGDDTNCASITCTVPTGACCFPDESCVDFMTAFDCQGQGGSFRGDGTECVSTDCGACDCIVGDANGDTEVNVGDAVYMINLVFKDGTDPIPYLICSGDSNCDCEANIGDAVYVINLVFKGGNPPCDCPTWLSFCGPPLRK